MTKHIKRIKVPKEIARGTNGKSAYIKLNVRLKTKHRRIFIQLGAMAGKVAGIKVESNGEDTNNDFSKKLALIEKFNELITQRDKVYAYIVRDWNWIDDETGDPLPKPYNNPAVFAEELYQEQEDWLQERVNDLINYRATEGNAESSTG